MIAKTTAQLLVDLGVEKTHNRPYTSNDNPFSESAFKTIKYHHQFPEQFGCLEDTKTFLRPFFDWYNNDHHHSALGLMTPNQIHYGQADDIIAARQQVLTQAYHAHPQRFVRHMPVPPAKPVAVWINPPQEKQNVNEIA
jgi:putative transposase